MALRVSYPSMPRTGADSKQCMSIQSTFSTDVTCSTPSSATSPSSTEFSWATRDSSCSLRESPFPSAFSSSSGSSLYDSSASCQSSVEGTEADLAGRLSSTSSADDITPPATRQVRGPIRSGILSHVAGYPVDIALEHVDEDLVCPVCMSIMRKPIQTNCGHRFCGACLTPILSGSEPKCPKDRSRLGGVFPDKCCEREINNLAVKCTNFAASCQWRGRLEDIDDHISICGFQPSTCPNEDCEVVIPRQQLEQHMEKDCLHQKLPCSLCQQPVKRHYMKEHARVDCPRALVRCPVDDCPEVFERCMRLNHEATCGYVMEQCQLGCGKMIQRQQFTSHCVDPPAMAEHMRCMMQQMTGLHQQLAQKDCIIREQQQELLQLKETVSVTLAEKVTGLTSQVDKMQLAIKEGQKDNSPKAADIERLVQRQISHVQSQVQTAVTSCSQVDAMVRRQSATSEEISKQFDSIDLRVLELETTSYGGFLVWKIRHFSQLLEDARLGKKTSHYSQPMYCGRYGYKACARVYPNGDGEGHGKYVSLFFAIMGGEFDAILPWPFTKRVTLTLLDQSPNKRHISETFVPDSRSSSFSRPTTGMNVASGCPCFVSHQVLNSTREQYLKDDTIFLRIKVDIAGMENI